MKVRYYIQVNMEQMEMLLNALEGIKTALPDKDVNKDYKALEKQIGPLNRYMKGAKK